jgi:hypothetical protein
MILYGKVIAKNDQVDQIGKDDTKMKYDRIGATLFAIAAFLYAMRYIAAALFMGPGLTNWDFSLFESAYAYVGNGLTNWAVIALVAGLIGMVVGIVKDFRAGKAGG